MWAELKRGNEGVSVTLYELDMDGDPAVVDEAWWTWAEFLGTKPPRGIDFGETGPVRILKRNGE